MFNNQIEREGQDAAVEQANDSDRSERIAIWVELPRQLLFLLLAVALAVLILVVLAYLVAADRGLGNIVWSESMIANQPLVELLSQRLANSMVLLLAAHFLALMLAVLPVAVAWLAHQLESQIGLVGSVVKGLGRLWAFSQGVLPVAALGVLLFWVFAVQLEWLPSGGMTTPGSDGFGDRLQHLVLPTVTLALLPTVLIAQAAARQLTLRNHNEGTWHWLAGVATLLGTWAGLVSYLLSALVVVEMIFNWPGLGRLLLDSLQRLDLPVFFGAILVMLGLLIPARLVAIFFRWLARFAARRADVAGKWVTPVANNGQSQWPQKAARIWFIGCMVVLLIPMGIFIVGATVDPETALAADAGDRLAAPSAEHPWGTDQLGRDLQAKALRGAYNSLGTAFLASLVLLVVAGMAGSLTGFLANLRTWWAESLADLLLLPADALLLFPAIPLAIALLLLLFEPGRTTVFVALLVTLFPRVMRGTHLIWLNQPEGSRIAWRLVIGAGAVLVAGAYVALALDISLGFLGYGLPELIPSLGNVLFSILRFPFRTDATMIWVVLLVLTCAVSLYLAADALIGYFTTKETMARLNE